MKQDSIQDLRAFDNHIFEVVQDFLDNKDTYSSDSVLSINAKTKEVSVDSPGDCENCNQYALTSLIRTDEQGVFEPDCDATYDLASQYYFVR